MFGIGSTSTTLHDLIFRKKKNKVSHIQILILLGKHFMQVITNSKFKFNLLNPNEANHMKNYFIKTERKKLLMNASNAFLEELLQYFGQSDEHQKYAIH